MLSFAHIDVVVVPLLLCRETKHSAHGDVVFTKGTVHGYMMMLLETMSK